MNSRLGIILLIGFIVVGALVYGGLDRDSGSNSKGDRVRAQEGTRFESQSKDMGAVNVEITPDILSPGQKMLFEVALNTHSVDLSYDYLTVFEAQDDRGKHYKALKWSGGEGGHHLRGNLVFEELSSDASEIIINVGGIDGENESYKWRLDGEGGEF